MSRLATVLVSALLAATANAQIAIQTGHPGANVLVERQEEQAVYLRQDLRDTTGWWFYWNFAATAPAGATVAFHFTGGNVIGTRGPALSVDGGHTWTWLGTDAVHTDGKRVHFTYTFDAKERPVHFAFAPPYQASNLAQFLAHHGQNPHLSIETLCQSEKGRNVERLHLGKLTGDPAYRIFLTARHHSCESMASYVLEGLMAAVLDAEDGAWFRDQVEILAIPFVDKDGVENGDQGKNRSPRDHGRDYQGESIYNSTRAIRALVPAWSGGQLHFALDLHCPHIRGNYNEHVYQVGHKNPAIWEEQQRFARLLASQPDLPLPYHAANDLPFGVAWNTPKNYQAGASMASWAATLHGIRYASTIEVPYANANDTTVTPERARAFGAALLPAIQTWLVSSGD